MGVASWANRSRDFADAQPGGRDHARQAQPFLCGRREAELGWPRESVAVVDEDTGRSGASSDGRLGFRELVAEVGLGQVGIILALEVSRLARSSADWHQLLDLWRSWCQVLHSRIGGDSLRCREGYSCGGEKKPRAQASLVGHNPAKMGECKT